MDNDYKKKYLKYKNKYLKLKNQQGGSSQSASASVSNDLFYNNVLKIFNHINIEHDNRMGDGDFIYLDKMFDYKNKKNELIGGNIKPYEITYDMTGVTNINTESIKEQKFRSNIGFVNDQNPNIIIIGGGPDGLFTSILYKIMYKDIDIYILEKRHDELLKRDLTRCQVVLLDKLNREYKYDKYVKYTYPTEQEYRETEFKFIELIPEEFKEYFYFEGTSEKNPFFSFIKFLGKGLNDKMPLNVLEYKLANFAQSIGVKIFHTEEITLDNLRLYKNDNTKIIFDTTGGKLRKDIIYENTVNDTNNYYSYCGYNIITPRLTLSENDYKGKFNMIITTNEGDIFYTTENISNTIPEKTLVFNKYGRDIEVNINLKNKFGPFKNKTGCLKPREAISKFDNIYLISIGDSYMKTNFQYGNGIYYGFMISFLIALEFYSLNKNNI